MIVVVLKFIRFSDPTRRVQCCCSGTLSNSFVSISKYWAKLSIPSTNVHLACAEALRILKVIYLSVFMSVQRFDYLVVSLADLFLETRASKFTRYQVLSIQRKHGMIPS